MSRCIAPPTVESETAILDKTLGELLGTTNPCTIPEKELRREQKRCKKCSVFSGANVMMQVQCVTQTRLIRANVLDRDMFDPKPRTPEHTSWTIRLLEQLDAPLKPGVIYRPMFPMPEERDTSKAAVLDPDVAQELAAGKYDPLFPSGPDVPSKLYEQALDRPPSPRVDLVGGSPIAPQEFVPPKYPPLARLAQIEGPVSVKVQFDEEGVVRDATIVDGYLQLQTAAVNGAWRWKFPKGEPNRETVVTVNFVLNCPSTKK
jgi:TonB family protein